VDNGTGFLWLGDAGRSFLGAHAPPDELNVAVAAGLDFGAPHCFGANEPDPSNPADCTGLAAPARLLAPHASPGGMRFYTPLADAAARLPTAYLGGLVFTERGSEGRRGVVGARLAFARLSAGRAAVEEVATAVAGFRGRGHLWPCAVPEDVAVAADGALLVTESRAGVVYRVSRA
jgi:glucose/arabinose dehydrogenase